MYLALLRVNRTFDGPVVENWVRLQWSQGCSSNIATLIDGDRKRDDDREALAPGIDVAVRELQYAARGFCASYNEISIPNANRYSRYRNRMLRAAIIYGRP